MIVRRVISMGRDTGCRGVPYPINLEGLGPGTISTP